MQLTAVPTKELKGLRKPPSGIKDLLSKIIILESLISQNRTQEELSRIKVSVVVLPL